MDIFKYFETKDALPVVMTLIKSGYVNQQLWISSHFNQLPKLIAPSKNAFHNSSQLQLLPQNMGFKTVNNKTNGDKSLTTYD